MPVFAKEDGVPPWLEGVQVGDLQQEQQQQLVQLLDQYQDVLSSDVLGCITFGACEINVQPGIQPISSRPYVYSLKKNLIQEEVSKLLSLDLIEPSKAPWSAPVVLVKKKDGSVRFCVDYRKLNAITTADVFPLPRIDETLDMLTGSTVFSTLDLKSGTGKFLFGNKIVIKLPLLRIKVYFVGKELLLVCEICLPYSRG